MKHAVICLEEEMRVLEQSLHDTNDRELGCAIIREMEEVSAALRLIRACALHGPVAPAKIMQRSPS